MAQCRLFVADLRALESSRFKAIRQLEANIRTAPICPAYGKKSETT